MVVDGKRRWVTFEELRPVDDDFGDLGEDFALTGLERRDPLGWGEGRLMRVREIVDFAQTWLSTHRH